jgi:hypothetical protein
VPFYDVFLDAGEHPTEKFDDRKIESPGGGLLSAVNFPASQILRSVSANLTQFQQFHTGRCAGVNLRDA